MLTLLLACLLGFVAQARFQNILVLFTLFFACLFQILTRVLSCLLSFVAQTCFQNVLVLFALFFACLFQILTRVLTRLFGFVAQTNVQNRLILFALRFSRFFQILACILTRLFRFVTQPRFQCLRILIVLGFTLLHFQRFVFHLRLILCHFRFTRCFGIGNGRILGQRPLGIGIIRLVSVAFRPRHIHDNQFTICNRCRFHKQPGAFRIHLSKILFDYGAAGESIDTRCRGEIIGVASHQQQDRQQQFRTQRQRIDIIHTDIALYFKIKRLADRLALHMHIIVQAALLNQLIFHFLGKCADRFAGQIHNPFNAKHKVVARHRAEACVHHKAVAGGNASVRTGGDAVFFLKGQICVRTCSVICFRHASPSLADQRFRRPNSKILFSFFLLSEGVRLLLICEISSHQRLRLLWSSRITSSLPQWK